MTTRHQIDGLSDDLLYTLFARYRNRCVFLDTVCCNCTRVIEVRHLCVPGNDLTTGRHRCSVISLAAFRKCFNYYRWMRSFGARLFDHSVKMRNELTFALAGQPQ